MPDFDAELRAAALSHVAAMEQRFGALSWEQIAAGFEFRGERVLLAGRARGIFKPRQLGAGALSIRTNVPREGRARRYDDQISSGEPYFIYRYQGDDPDAADNRNLRDCLRLGLPLIYFYGVDEAVYQPIFCALAGEDRAAKAFHVTPVARDTPVAGAALRIERRYSIVEVRQRLHQQKFRSVVLRAYELRCAICRLRHLLDAAHIVADGEQLGEARVPNGLALCKLHHAAFDSDLLGISPDLAIHLVPGLLHEQDGPMLEHGLRAFEGERLNVPASREDRPDRDLLALRWARFRAA